MGIEQSEPHEVELAFFSGCADQDTILFVTFIAGTASKHLSPACNPGGERGLKLKMVAVFCLYSNVCSKIQYCETTLC